MAKTNKKTKVSSLRLLDKANKTKEVSDEKKKQAFEALDASVGETAQNLEKLKMLFKEIEDDICIDDKDDKIAIGK